MAACFADRSTTWENVVKSSAQFDYYLTGVKCESVTAQVPNAAQLVQGDTLQSINATEIKVISESQYNAVCAVTVLASTLFAELGVDLTSSIALSASAMVVVYAIYLAATYLLSKNVVRSTLGE